MHGSTCTGTNRCLPSSFLSSAEVHSSVVYRRSSKYAEENSATTRFAASTAPRILVTKFSAPGVTDEEVHSRHALHTLPALHTSDHRPSMPGQVKT